jgi:hypothetical protein
MTLALCLACGDIKFGAICPCPNCQVTSSGDMNLDIALSDHRVAVETLDLLGDVIRQIARHCDDEELRPWAFLAYLSEHHSDILTVDLEPVVASRIEDVLDKLEPPRHGTASARSFWKPGT